MWASSSAALAVVSVPPANPSSWSSGGQPVTGVRDTRTGRTAPRILCATGAPLGARTGMHTSLDTDELRPLDALPSKIFAYFGSAALGFVAVLDATIAGVALFSGRLIGALGEASGPEHAEVAARASHDALLAKLVAAAFAVVAIAQFAGAAVIRQRVRSRYVPIILALTIAVQLGFSAWSGKFTALDLVVVGCVAFAGFAWQRTARRR
jgi:hypothetical protein